MHRATPPWIALTLLLFACGEEAGIVEALTGEAPGRARPEADAGAADGLVADAFALDARPKPPPDLCEPWGVWNTERTGDCNDDRADLNPGARELCDGADNDCNPQTLDGTHERVAPRPRCVDGACVQ